MVVLLVVSFQFDYVVARNGIEDIVFLNFSDYVFVVFLVQKQLDISWYK